MQRDTRQAQNGVTRKRRWGDWGFLPGGSAGDKTEHLGPELRGQWGHSDTVKLNIWQNQDKIIAVLDIICILYNPHLQSVWFSMVRICSTITTV